jgi:hypothetical protein
MAALRDLFRLEFDRRRSLPVRRSSATASMARASGPRTGAREREQGLAAHASEIELVLGWSEAVAGHCAIPMRLPAPLL